MIAFVLFLSCLLVCVGIGGLAALSDVRGLKIPNLYSAFVLGAFAVAYGGLWALDIQIFESLISHILAGALVFLVTLAMFAVGGLGAADSKLGTAYALWVGLKGLVPFLFYMALAGGGLAVIALLIGKFKPFRSPQPGSWAARLQAGESKVPYGVAIVIGALVSFVKLGYFSGEIYASFF